MPSKNTDSGKNSLKDLEKKISPIMVVNNSTLKPYVELFEYAPENIYQQPLGSLVGFFEVKEYSEESAYIVNFLTSVLKKEYYINPKRPVAESLDSALHKINLALSELAKQGNVEWLGKLNAAICVLEKNNAHFSVSGNAKIFLYRKQILTDISEGLAQDEVQPHPLKTFVNVSSGRLEKDDRLLITSEDIFHILPETDLKKNFQRFEGEKFVQFLKTALSNQLEMIVSVVVELKEITDKKAKVTAKPDLIQEETANVFSEKTFSAQNPITVEETLALAEALEQEGEEVEYIDKKTGHIYIQGETDEIPPISPMLVYWDMTKEKAAEGWFVAKNDLRRRYIQFKKQVAKKVELRRQEKERKAELAAQEAARLEEQLKQEEQLRLQQEQQFKLEEEKRLQEIEQRNLITESITDSNSNEVSLVKEEVIPVQNEENNAKATKEKALSFQEKLKLAQAQQKRSPVIDLRPKAKVEEINPPAGGEIPEQLQAEEFEHFSDEELPISVNLIEDTGKLSQIADTIKPRWENFYKRAAFASKNFILQALNKIRNYRSQINTQPVDTLAPKTEHHFAPRLETITKSYTKFSKKQKYYTLGAIVLVFIVPFFIARYLNRPKPKPITELQTSPVPATELLAGEKNINLSPKEQKVLSRSDLVSTLITSSGPASITKDEVILLNDQTKTYPLPDGSGKAIKATYMSDLALILIVTDKNSVVSFSPNSLKYTDNKIDLTGNASGSFFGTYMTYLYVLDPGANQIYRYPRADGGFGDKTNWYRDSISLTGTGDIAIDDSIYTIANNKVLKFFKGQSQPLNMEASRTPIRFGKLFTNLDSTNLWVLDTENSRIIKFTKDGSIVSQYFDENLKGGTSLAVDEKINTAYVTTSSGLISVTVQ